MQIVRRDVFVDPKGNITVVVYEPPGSHPTPKKEPRK